MVLENLLRAILLGLILAVSTAAGQDIVEYQIWMQRGAALRSQMEYGRALEALDRAASLRPRAVRPGLWAGEILLAQRRWEDAERKLLRVVEGDPNNSAAWYALGEAAMGRGEREAAQQRWRAALTQDPAHSEAWLALAKVYINQQEWDLAVVALESAVSGRRGAEGASTEARALYLLGLITAWEDPDTAMRHLERAGGLGIPELEEGISRAVQGLEGLALPPRDSTGWGELGRLYLALDQPEMAYRALEQGLETDGEVPRLRAYLGYAAWRLGLSSEAARHLHLAREGDPNDALPLYFEALLFRGRGQTEFAMNALQAALYRDPQNPAFYAALGDLLLDEQEYLSAREAYLRATEAAPFDPEFHLLRAGFHLRTLLWIQDAVESAEAAVGLEPESPLAQEYLGWARYLSGDLEAAVDPLERAVVLDPAAARSHYRLGILRIAMGQLDAGRMELGRAVDLDPEGTYGRRAALVLERMDSGAAGIGAV